MTATRVRGKTNFTEGPMFLRILAYSIPIILTNLIQMLYATADKIVVGQFSSNPHALGAIGSTGSLTSLVLNVLFGCSAGASVVVAQSIGAGKREDISRAVHTTVTFAAIGGIAIMAIGLAVTEPILIALNTKDVMLDDAVLYAKIIFLGTLGAAITNFGSAIIRASGDSRTPFLILTASGLVNVLINLILVVFFDMGVAGVAIGTIAAQYSSAAAMIIKLMRSRDALKLSPKLLGIDRSIFAKIMKIGVPSALQTSFFSLSNIFVTGASNSFTPAEVSGKSIAESFEGYVHNIMNGFYASSITVIGQNYGAGKFDRVKRSYLYCLFWVTASAVLVAGLEIIFADPLAHLFVDKTLAESPAIVDATRRRLIITLSGIFLSGAMNVSSGHLRAIGCSIPPMLSAIVINGVFRVMWIWFIFSLPGMQTFLGLYIVYPITWGLNFLANLIIIRLVREHSFERKRLELAKKA